LLSEGFSEQWFQPGPFFGAIFGGEQVEQAILIAAAVVVDDGIVGAVHQERRNGTRGNSVERAWHGRRIGRQDPDATIAATLGVIPLSVGLGFFVDHALIRRDARAH
jgi:hypothetical protein